MEPPPASSSGLLSAPSSSIGTPAYSIGHNDESGMGIAELELLHHYSTSTCYTLARHPLLQNLWRITIPQYGFASSFVIRAVLAISALHLAYVKPERKDLYISHALHHHDIALRAVTSILPDMTRDNCCALYLFSVMTCIISCAKPHRQGDFLLIGEGGISEWLTIFRGARTIIEHASDTVRAGPLAPMFTSGERKLRLREERFTGAQNYMLELRQNIEGAVRDSVTLQIYLDSLEEMSKSFGMVLDGDAQSCESADVFIWLFLVSDDYLRLLNERTPESLVILGYFCVILKQLEWTWWIQGRSTYLIAGIYWLLDEEHRLWIQWPMEQIGWVP